MTKNKREIKINEKEKYAIEKFKDNHKCNFIRELNKSKLNKTTKEIINKLLFDVDYHQTEVGTNVVVECCACEEQFNVTDYDSW